MPWITLFLEQLMQWKLGFMGGVSASLMAAGIKLGNTKCLIVGCVILALLLGAAHDSHATPSTHQKSAHIASLSQFDSNACNVCTMPT
ncbi:hypothetical protein ACIQ6K_31930 [Streptomyces sp. NPDC096354]|uniref:hypothetical protein n=1 Tax=Streptomyces sp. NPDC096354 TaxID=3366088 RepID=UPI0038258356